MQELVSASMVRKPSGLWRVRVRFMGSSIEQDFEDRRIAWEYVLGWMPREEGTA